jgi:hypothetical protein
MLHPAVRFLSPAQVFSTAASTYAREAWRETLVFQRFQEKSGAR